MDETVSVPSSVTERLRAYLRSLSPESRRRLLETIEEGMILGRSLVTSGHADTDILDALNGLDVADAPHDYPPLWRAVCFSCEHALTDHWGTLSPWDIPRPALGGLYTFVRLRLSEWDILAQSYDAATSPAGRHVTLCAALSLVGSLVAENVNEPVLVEALRRRTRLNGEEVVQVARLFSQLVTIGPGFLDTMGDAFGLPVEELAVLPLMPVALRRPFTFDQAAVREVASRYARLPAATDRQNQLVATQTAIVLADPAEVLRMIPMNLRRDEMALRASGFAPVAEYVFHRLDRHARELRHHLARMATMEIDDPGLGSTLSIVIGLIEAHTREIATTRRHTRLENNSPWANQIRQTERDIADSLVHDALPICWKGLQASSMFTLTTLEKPRPTPTLARRTNERRVFRLIGVIGPVIDATHNRLAFDGLRTTLSSVVTSWMNSLKPSWFASYRATRDEAAAMAGHLICLLGALGRDADAKTLAGRLNQQRVPLVEALGCGADCDGSCDVVTRLAHRGV